MTRNSRLALLAAAAAILVIAIVVIGTGGDDSSSSTSSSNSTDSNSNSSSSAPKPAKPPTVVVKNAKPVGGVQEFTFKKGGTVDLTVKSDTADEVHFHGYDVHKDVEKGGTVRFKFPAKIDGRFVVELEDHKVTLANVDVEP
jgi:hypothetical protein